MAKRDSLATTYKATLEEERAWCLSSLEAHIVIACEKVFDETVHGDIIRAAEQGDFYELVCMLPRGHFKTTLFACILTWFIAKDRNTTSCIVGAIHSTGADTVFAIRQILESERMTEIYGEFKGDSVWNNEELVVRGRTETMRESTVKVMGVESFKPGGHYRILWFDDPEDQNTVNTTDLLAKTREVYALGRPMADKPDSQRWLTGTFWADNDLYSHLIQQYGLGRVDEESGVLVVLNGQRSKSGKQIVFFKPAEDEGGNPLFPSRFSKELLSEIKAEMEFTSPGSYDKQYLLNPVTNKNARFRTDDYVSAASPPLGNLEVAFGMDFAQSKTEGSDRSGIVGFFHTPDYLFYIFEASELAIDAEKQQLAIFDRHMAFPRARFYVEADNFVKGWKPQFDAECRKRGIFPIVEWIDSGARKKKDDRINATEGLFRAKRVIFLPGTNALWTQLSRMPASRRKDVADAFTNPIPFIVPSFKTENDVGSKSPLRSWMRLIQNGANDSAPWEHGSKDQNTPYSNRRGEDVPWQAS